MQKSTSKSLYLYGKHVVAMAVQNPRRRILEIYATKETAAEMNLPQNIPVHPADRKFLDSLVGQGAVHQGVVAKCEPLSPVDLKEFIKGVKDKDKCLIIVLDQVTDPHNIGAIMRSAVAFNASAIIMPEAGAPSESGTLAKSASGATELIPVIRVSNLVHAMDMLKKAEFWCVGLDGYAKDYITDRKLPKKCVLILGAEDGMRRLTMENCDMVVKLPMNSAIESLNVSNAAAVAMYEWNRG
ncbi:MAG: 23S rRNA (guanosine(2251)-2'-O)-methyltransferase RlmB [Alphaproteobacteria bacterium]|nr:23S rRNA (guanosine(2251)-2'-O)-methyltransferase RlmB [Alphaproteobacteria bacterium]